MSLKIELLRVMETVYLGVCSIILHKDSYQVQKEFGVIFGIFVIIVVLGLCIVVNYSRGISERHLLHKSVQDSAGFSSELIENASMSSSFMGILRDMVKLFYTDTLS